MATENGEQSQSTEKPGDGIKPDAGVKEPQTTEKPIVKQDPAPGEKRGVDETAHRGVIADLQKERLARQKLQSQFDQLSGEREADRRRIAALAGVNVPTTEEAELEDVRARLVKLFPALGKLNDEALTRLMNLADDSQGIQDATQHHWQTHGRSMLAAVTSAVVELSGSDLTERQKKALAREYVAEAEANPEFLKRHTSGDQTLIAEFAKQWVEDWFEPARKQLVTQEVARRRPVPSGRDRNVQTAPPKKIDYKDEKAVEDAMVESFRSHGGRFEQ